MKTRDFIIDYNMPVLITGSSGFIGSKVVEMLLERGFSNLRCLVRPSSNLTTLNGLIAKYSAAKIDLIRGNLLSARDCEKLTENISVVYHLAAARGHKSYPDAYLNTVVALRNLLDATVRTDTVKRFVNVSSFTVYSNIKLERGELLDESCDLEANPHSRGEAYCYAKVKQDQLVLEYAGKYGLPYVIVRPGVVYGPGNPGITGRVGISTFGIFLHLGGSNTLPLTYVDNCAEAIALAGLKPNVDGEVFNVVDDDLPTSRKLLVMYKKNVKNFRSIYVPYPLFYLFSSIWQKYSIWSNGQLPPLFTTCRCSAYWKGNKYSNEKIKKLLEWKPRVNFNEASQRYFEYCKKVARNHD